MSERFYDKSPEQLAMMFETDLTSGLSKKSARARLRHDGNNLIFPIPRLPFLAFVRRVGSDVTTYMLVAMALLSVIFKQDVSAVVLITLIVINFFAVLFTYAKSQRIIEDTAHYSIPAAKVMRQGRLYMVKQEQLVRGDIILLNTGDIVPADARLTTSNSLNVLEVNLTEYDKSSSKDASFIEWKSIPPQEQRNMVFASTIITEGNAKAIVCRTGDDTLVSTLNKNNSLKNGADRLHVLKTLRRYCRAWSLFMVAMILCMTALDLIFGLQTRSLFKIFVTGLSMAAASMSELYSVFGYIIIGCGIFGNTKKAGGLNVGSIIKNVASLEQIKDVSVLMVPKEDAFCSRNLSITGLYHSGTIYKTTEKNLSSSCGRLIRGAVISTALYGSDKLARESADFEGSMTPEERAIIAVAEEADLYNIELDREYPIYDHESVSRTNRFETTLILHGDIHRVLMRGDVTSLLANCHTYFEDGAEHPLTPDMRQRILSDAGFLTTDTDRVIAVASKNTYFNNLHKLVTCQSSLCFEGLLIINEPLMPGVQKCVSACLNAGVKVIVMCPDVSPNNEKLADNLGITEKDTRILTPYELSHTCEADLRRDISKYRLYQGLSVSQKRTALRYLHESGEIVGFMGGTQEDIILLKEADVSAAPCVSIAHSNIEGVDLYSPQSRNTNLALNEGNCDAVRYISDIIVSKADRNGFGGFNAFVRAISSAKVIYQNLVRMVWYLITSQVARFFIVLYSVIANDTALTPVQILFCGLIIDFAAVVTISFQRPPSDILAQREDTEEKLDRPFTKNIPCLLFGVFWAALSILLPKLIALSGLHEVTASEFITTVFVSFILSQLITLDEMMKVKSLLSQGRRHNRVYMATVFFSVLFVAASFALDFLGRRFNIGAVSPIMLIPMLMIPLILFSVFEVYKKFSATKTKRSDVPDKM